MFHSLLVPNITSLGATNEVDQWDNRPFITKWPEQDKSKKVEEVTKTIKKRSKRFRTAFTTEQLNLLEKLFTENTYIDSKERQKISKIIKVGEKQIKVWFQNRRMKEKKRSSESNSDSCSETSSVPSSPPQVNTNDSLSPPPVATTNEFTATNDYGSNGFVESEYQLPNYVSNATINNFGYNDSYANNLDYCNYFQADSYYGFNQMKSESAAHYDAQNYNIEPFGGNLTNWYGHYNTNPEYYNNNWQ